MKWFRKWRHNRPRKDRSVRFYTRENCPLCVDALAILRKYASDYQLKIEIIDVTKDPQLEAQYGHEIPVVFVDDKKRFFGHVDSVLLLRLLNRPPECE